MIKKYVEWLKHYWSNFFTPQGLAIYIVTVLVSNIVGKTLSAFFSKKADEQIKKLEEENGKDELRNARIESSYNQAQIITGAVAGTVISVISMILISKLPLKKGEN